MSYYQQPSFQPPHYYPANDSGIPFQREFPPPNAEVYTSQPYQAYPMVAPQTTVFIYEDQPAFRQRDDGLFAALCAACLCCWLLPPLTWHWCCWYQGITVQANCKLRLPFDLNFLGFPVNLTVAFKRLNCTKMVRLAEMDKIIKLKDKADGMQWKTVSMQTKLTRATILFCKYKSISKRTFSFENFVFICVF